jgi:hypothetical protein
MSEVVQGALQQRQEGNQQRLGPIGCISSDRFLATLT